MTGVIGRGKIFGKWTLEKRLGRGGNSEVWEVRSRGLDVCAMKLLRVPKDRYRLARFRDEIQFLLAHPEIAGIVPILDWNIDLIPPGVPWYVMPKAVPLVHALGTDPTPADVLSAILPIAETLASLANQGIGHRDIKPDNLFELDGRPAVGDFGLVTSPDKEPQTRHGRRLGPIDFMAPEMRENADNARPEPADVWALSKTLWVMLTGQNTPPPGSHTPSEPASSLRERIVFTWVNELDLLMERCTRMVPDHRESLPGVADELRACLEPPPEDRPTADLSELRARTSALSSRERRNAESLQNRRSRRNAAWDAVHAVHNRSWNELAKIIGFGGPIGNTDAEAFQLLGLHTTPYASFSVGGKLTLPGPQKVQLSLAVAMGLTDEDGPAKIAALYVGAPGTWRRHSSHLPC